MDPKIGELIQELDTLNFGELINKTTGAKHG